MKQFTTELTADWEEEKRQEEDSEEEGSTGNEYEADEDIGNDDDERREDQDADDDENGGEEADEAVRNGGVDGMEDQDADDDENGGKEANEDVRNYGVEVMEDQDADDNENEGEGVVHEVVGSDGDKGRGDRDADDNKIGGRDDVVDAHENDHVGQDLPNESPVVDVGLSNAGNAKVVVHEKDNGGCDSYSDDEPLTKQAPNAEFTIQKRKKNDRLRYSPPLQTGESRKRG